MRRIISFSKLRKGATMPKQRRNVVQPSRESTMRDMDKHMDKLPQCRGHATMPSRILTLITRITLGRKNRRNRTGCRNKSAHSVGTSSWYQGLITRPVLLRRRIHRPHRPLGRWSVRLPLNNRIETKSNPRDMAGRAALSLSSDAPLPSRLLSAALKRRTSSIRWP